MRAAGRAGCLVGLRIVDNASGRDVPEGEVGEVWIRSPQNMRGYWRNPQATEQAFPEGRDARGGWFRTGDAGTMRDGYLFIQDRIKDMIISGGGVQRLSERGRGRRGGAPGRARMRGGGLAL